MDQETGSSPILDLDETLVHAVVRPLARPDDNQAGPYLVDARPRLEEFLGRRLFS